MGKRIKLTKKILLDASTYGEGNGYTKEQIKALGLTYPQKKGWKREVIGRHYPEEVIETLLNNKGKISGKTLKTHEENEKGFQARVFLRKLSIEEWNKFKQLCFENDIDSDMVVEELIINKMELLKNSKES